MSAAPQENPVQTHEAQKKAEEETNLVKQRKHYERQLEQERYAREQAELRATQIEKEAQARRTQVDDDDGDDEPYVDHKRLAKKFSSFEASLDKKIEQKAEEKARRMLNEERQSQWLKNNPDFEEVMQHAEKFYQKDKEFAENVLQMPEGFERQKLAYHAIKALGLHKKEEPKTNIQETIDKNKRSPYYQPSGVGTAPYGVFNLGRDVSPAEGQNAYKKLQELKGRLRLG
ncbi:MAG TPA: hypothetical protein DCP92_24715 [Nitrospiraceae bacterium]|jgi:hypothetical protein|nr:hypothetical protein [Nitrospiraceae bacterium]